MFDRSSRARPFVAVLGLLAAQLVACRRNEPAAGPDSAPARTRRPLILALDRAVPMVGFSDAIRQIDPLGDPDRNVDDSGIPFAMPHTGQVVFRGVEGGPRSSLRIGFGVEAVQAKEAEGVAVVFRARVVATGVDEVVFRRTIEVGPVASAPDRRWDRVALPPAVESGPFDLWLETSSATKLDPSAFVPVFLSPVVDVDSPVPRAARRTARLVRRELLDEAELALAGMANAKRVTFAQRQGDDGAPEQLEMDAYGLTASFVATTRQSTGGGGARPALYFCEALPATSFDVDVSDAGGVLAFAVGLDHRSWTIGAAAFRVDVDGQRTFERTLDPAERPGDRGWIPVEIDLTPWRGRRVEVAFSGDTTTRGAELVPVREWGPHGPLPPRMHRIERVRAAFGRPCVIEEVEVGYRASSAERPSVLLINVETFRTDAVGAFGGRADATPNLDRLASEGVRVEECITVAPWTPPSVASLLTGVYPWTHGVLSRQRIYLPGAFETLAERALAAGARTLAICTNGLISRSHNFDQGFEDFIAPSFANARQVVETFGDWLVEHEGRQFFAYLHVFEPHYPPNAPGDDAYRYVPDRLRHLDAPAALARILERGKRGERVSPDDDDIELLRTMYLGEVRYFDRQLARLEEILRERDLIGRVIVVVTGDHGEEFGEHGMLGHGSQLFGESVRVPLVFWGPGIVPEGVVVQGPLENRALYATCLALMNVPLAPDEAASALRFTGRAPRGEAYTTTSVGLHPSTQAEAHYETHHAIRTRSASFLYVPSRTFEDDPPRYRAFGLADDPGETRDVHHANETLVRELKERMKKAYAIATRRREGLPVGELDRGAAETMAQLGYIVGTSNERADTVLFPEDED